MREIKFRGKRVDNGFWIYGLLHVIDTFGKGYTGRAIQVQTNEIRPFSIQVDVLTVGQYTGLTDKNGVEIYEGDIVKLMKPDSQYVIKGDGYEDVENDVGFEVTGEVKFLYSMWFVEDTDERGLPLDFDENQLLEVIGNIYENPQMLGEIE